MKGKWIRLTAVMVFGVLMMSGCSLFSGSLIQEEIPGPSESPAADIAPDVGESQKEVQGTTLYFRFLDEPYLTAETRKIQVAANERTEAGIVKELIRGPSQVELRSLFNGDTKVVSVSESNGYLFVTLSREFLDPADALGDLPDNWAEDPKTVEQVNEYKRLAIYSIINSLTELGNFSGVQILIDVENTGKGERVRRSLLGFQDGTNDDQLMEPMYRQNDVILTPRTTMSIALDCFSKKSWDRLYKYVASKDEQGVSRPTLEEVTNNLSVQDPTLESYTVVHESVSLDGQTAVVCVNVKIRYSDGIIAEKQNVPLRMRRENQIWKINYSALSSVLSKQL